MIRDLLSPLIWLLDQVLTALHDVGLSWGWSIVALTLLVRVVILPLSIRQIRLTMRSQEVAPELARLRDEHKDSSQEELVEALTAFYKEHGGHPLSSCLLVLPQIPIFVALFFLLNGGESAISGSWLFIADLNADPTGWTRWLIVFILVSTSLAASRLSVIGPLQPRHYPVMLLPVIGYGAFAALIPYPAGLMVYWMVSSLVTLALALFFRPARRRQHEMLAAHLGEPPS